MSVPGAAAPRPWRRAPSVAGWVVLALALALLCALFLRRPGLERLWGDEGTYVAMAASLARDGDLAFDERDLEWARQRLPEGVTVILQRTERGLSYSKPVVYALLAAPGFRWLGEMTLPLLNLLALLGGLACAWSALRRLGPRDRVWLTLVTFLSGGLLVAYVAWRMSDALQAALALAGLALGCAALRRRDAGSGAGRWLESGWTAAAAGVLLGLAAAMRMPNAALVAGAAAANLVAARRRRAVALLLAAVVAWGAAAWAGHALTGAVNPYRALRTSFDGSTGYPVGPGGEEAAKRFETDTATTRIGLVPDSRPPRILYAALYFLVGRHTGVALYFPCAVLLAAVALRRPGSVGRPLLAAAAAMSLFYVVWLPWNYFGGSTFLGNRYFLTVYPALLLALPRLPRWHQLVPVWAVAAAVGLSAWLSVARTADVDRMSQSHASAGLFRLLPYESTARRIDGQRDRYWAGDFVRFVDPYARVEPHAFVLTSERPAAELLVATAGADRPLVLLVSADHPEAEVRFGDWGTAATYRLRPGIGGATARIRLRPSPAWRFHRFWWTDATAYRARSLRLAVRGPGEGVVSAELRYLGDGSLLARPLARQVTELELPVEARAGERSTVAVRVRNTGDWTWKSADLVPVLLSYRLYRGEAVRPSEGPRQPLPYPVAPGEELAAELEVLWPAEPGRYRLVVDLLLQRVAWFADRLGEPLAEGRVRVRAAAPG